jgi:hypothetical protein
LYLDVNKDYWKDESDSKKYYSEYNKENITFTQNNGQTLIPSKNSVKNLQMERIDDRIGMRGIILINSSNFRIRLQYRK